MRPEGLRERKRSETSAGRGRRGVSAPVVWFTLRLAVEPPLLCFPHAHVDPEASPC